MNLSTTKCLVSLMQRMPRHTLCLNAQKRLIHSQDLVPCASLVEQFKRASDEKKVLQTLTVSPTFRTGESDPGNHGLHHEALFYTMPEDVTKQLFPKGLPVQFKKFSKILQESCVMVRKPALEVIDYLKQIDYDYPVPRFLLYGKRGAGKTLSLAHILHYCSTNKWILVHVPWPAHWNVHFKELSPSSHRSGRIDLPIEAAEWLMQFRTQNQSLLDGLETTATYTWSKRESSEQGTPLINIVEFGLNRVKFAADCVGVVLKEIKLQANRKKIKVLVSVDGVNSFWTDTCMKTLEKVQVQPEELTLIHNFKKMLTNDWTNGAVVCTVDNMASSRFKRDSHMPLYLLGKKGFECLDPFVPINVPYYSEKEAYSCLEYYIYMKWIQSSQAQTEEGMKELIFLSSGNPFKLFNLCASR